MADGSAGVPRVLIDTPCWEYPYADNKRQKAKESTLTNCILDVLPEVNVLFIFIV